MPTCDTMMQSPASGEPDVERRGISQLGADLDHALDVAPLGDLQDVIAGLGCVERVVARLDAYDLLVESARERISTVPVLTIHVAPHKAAA